MLIDKLTGLRVEVRDRSIGPAHDPYGQTEVMLSLPDGTYATYLHNGLGTNKASFYSDTNGSEPVRAFDWHYIGLSDESVHKENMVRVNTVAKQVFGVSFDEAYEHYCEHYEEDPMGSPSKYI